jgi:hypothetical protein
MSLIQGDLGFRALNPYVEQWIVWAFTKAKIKLVREHLFQNLHLIMANLNKDWRRRHRHCKPSSGSGRTGEYFLADFTKIPTLHRDISDDRNKIECGNWVLKPHLSEKTIPRMTQACSHQSYLIIKIYAK